MKVGQIVLGLPDDAQERECGENRAMRLGSDRAASGLIAVGVLALCDVGPTERTYPSILSQLRVAQAQPNMSAHGGCAVCATVEEGQSNYPSGIPVFLYFALVIFGFIDPM